MLHIQVCASHLQQWRHTQVRCTTSHHVLFLCAKAMSLCSLDGRSSTKHRREYYTSLGKGSAHSQSDGLMHSRCRFSGTASQLYCPRHTKYCSVDCHMHRRCASLELAFPGTETIFWGRRLTPGRGGAFTCQSGQRGTCEWSVGERRLSRRSTDNASSDTRQHLCSGVSELV